MITLWSLLKFQMALYSSGFLKRPQKFDEISQLTFAGMLKKLKIGQILWLSYKIWTLINLCNLFLIHFNHCRNNSGLWGVYSSIIFRKYLHRDIVMFNDRFSNPEGEAAVMLQTYKIVELTDFPLKSISTLTWRSWRFKNSLEQFRCFCHSDLFSFQALKILLSSSVPAAASSGFK